MYRLNTSLLAALQVVGMVAFCNESTAQDSARAREVAIDSRGVRGTRMLGGGGKLPDSIYEHFLELAGGKQAQIVIIPTASSSADTAEGRASTLKRWQDAHPGYDFTVLHTRDRTVANSNEFGDQIKTATAVWFGGGAQSRLAEAYLDTRFENELHALLARGGVIGGSSAGTAIQTRTMIAGGMAPPRLATGFDFVPFAIADQHFSQRSRLPRLLLALAATPGHFGVGIDEGTAIVVQNRSVKVLGKGKVTFALAATESQPQRLLERTAGEEVDLPTWQRAAIARSRGAWPPQHMAQPTLKSGSLVLCSQRQPPDAALARFVELAGGKDKARIVVVPIATPSLARHSDRVRTQLHALGIRNYQILAPEHANDVDQRHLDMTNQATGIWFDTGRSFRIVDTFEHTALPDAMQRVLARGGVIGGLASIQSEFLLRGDPGSQKQLHCEGYDHGLALLPGCAIDDQFSSLDGKQGLLDLIANAPQMLGIGIDDRTAAVITGSTLEVLGDGTVSIVSMKQGDEHARCAVAAAGDQLHLTR